MSRRFDSSKYLLAALAEVPRVEVPLGGAGGSADARDDALAASADVLLPDEVEHGLEQLQAAVARLGGDGLRDVEHPPVRTRRRRK